MEYAFKGYVKTIICEKVKAKRKYTYNYKVSFEYSSVVGLEKDTYLALPDTGDVFLILEEKPFNVDDHFLNVLNVAFQERRKVKIFFEKINGGTDINGEITKVELCYD